MKKHIEKKELAVFAEQIRIETLRELGHLGFGHIGGAMSIVETLAVLYGEVMRIDPTNPQWEERDWLVVSKGHAGPALYATLALKGYFPMEMLSTLNQPQTNLPSHCDRNKTPGVDMTTGSLGQGMSTAIGIAMGNRLDKRSSKTYLVLGDGECDEGQVWEGALFAAHNKLDSLIAFIDVNKKQLDGYTKDINDLGDIGKKFASFGWHVYYVDGSNVDEIFKAVTSAAQSKGKPSAIMLDTVKGQGCSFAEMEFSNHHMRFTAEQIAAAVAESEERLAAIKAE